MSQLRLFRPARPESSNRLSGCADGPVILSFPATYARLRRGSLANPVARARILHKNRCCPGCRHAIVEPLELNDSLFNRSNLPIPGTATLVGFYCGKCHREWPAEVGGEL
ncbi:MAG TPA: hypothetical protein VML55_21235 [Planctomycetaceae bacterium]|nr:hypothetical protein [Planctomycetaceae bacterium]